MSYDTLQLLERLQKIDMNESKSRIEMTLDQLADIGGSELKDIWDSEVHSKKGAPEGKLDVIDDIMMSRFGKTYSKYLKGQAIGESKGGDNVYDRMPIDRVIQDANHGVSLAKQSLYDRDLEKYRELFGNVVGPQKEAKKKKEEAVVVEVPQTMQPTEEPDVCPKAQSMEPGDKSPDTKKQDTMSEPLKKELEQLIDNLYKNKTNEDLATMFKQDKIDVMKDKLLGLKAQAAQLEKDQRGTSKSSRGYTLQNLYAKIDEYEKEIAVLQKAIGESKVTEPVESDLKPKTKSRFERKQLYICNSCVKTFRNNVNECIYCKSTHVEKLGEIKEQDESDYNTIAQGIEDKDTADQLAKEKKGTVVQDETDEKKFAVIVKVDEDYSDKYNPETNLRSMIIEMFYKKGFSLSEEAEQGQLTFSKGSTGDKFDAVEIKVIIPVTESIKIGEKVDYDALRAEILILMNDPRTDDDKIYRVLSKKYPVGTIEIVLNGMRNVSKNVGPLD